MPELLAGGVIHIYTIARRSNPYLAILRLVDEGNVVIADGMWRFARFQILESVGLAIVDADALPLG